MDTYARLQDITDGNSFIEYNDEIDVSRAYINADYQAKIERHRQKYGVDEAVLTGKASISGCQVALGIMDSRFLRASMGYYVGEKITRLFEHATDERLPVVLFCASGGARVQEGIISLLQMQKTTQACERHGKAGLLYISVLTNPTMGGVTASFATNADIIIAEENALVGFTGQRVIEQTTGEKLPEGFQTAEFQKKHGLVDEVVSEKNMKDYLGHLLKLFEAGNAGLIRDSENNRDKSIDEHKVDTSDKHKNYDDETAANTVVAHSTEEAWEIVRLARKITRPTSADYIHKLFSGFTELHGDRISGDDHAVVGGIGLFNGKPVMAIGQQKGKHSVKEALYRNWGMVSPSGHHKTMRLMKLAEKFRIPIVCFVDTMGAACGKNAEEMGQAGVISGMLATASELETPVLSIIVGEAGSGGALAFSVANEVWMLENSVFSVITPEGYASIVWKDADRKSEASRIMGMLPTQLYEKGVIDRIISEKEPVTAETLGAVCEEIALHMNSFLDKYGNMSREEVVENRYERYRKF